MGSAIRGSLPGSSLEGIDDRPDRVEHLIGPELLLLLPFECGNTLSIFRNYRREWSFARYYRGWSTPL